MEIRPFLSALTVSFNPLAETRKYLPRTGEEAGGKLNDILHKYRGFLFRQTRCRGQVPFSSDDPLTRIFRFVIPTENSFSIGTPETAHPFILTLP